MKWTKNLLTIAMMIAMMSFFTACDDDSPTEPDKEKPDAPTNLMATSINESTIHIKWDAPSTLDNDLFESYQVTYYPEGGTAGEALESVEAGQPFPLTNLTNGTVYVIEVVTVYSNGESSDATTMMWAPAMRFEQVDANTIRVYDSQASAGSGLVLFDSFLETPSVETVANIAIWNLGLDTKVAGTVKFGSASQLDYNGAATAASAHIGNLTAVNSLNDLFDSEAMDMKQYSESAPDLNAIDTQGAGGIAFYVRAESETAGIYNYAKVFVKYENGSFLKEDGLGSYVEVVISYQKEAGVPYAK